MFELSCLEDHLQVLDQVAGAFNPLPQVLYPVPLRHFILHYVLVVHANLVNGIPEERVMVKHHESLALVPTHLLVLRSIYPKLNYL